MEGVITHTKYITIANTQTSSVTFNDASGALINCNFIAVGCSAAAAYVVTPSAISLYPVVPFGNGTSGTFGYGVATTGGMENIVLGYNRYCQAISIRNSSGASRDFVVTYGIQTANPSFPRGYNPGI